MSGGPGDLADEHVQDAHAPGPGVRGGGQGLAGDLFRGGIGARGGARLAVPPDLREARVADDHVGRLDVVVDAVLPVEPGQAAGRLGGHAEHGGQFPQVALLDGGVPELALEVRHQQERDLAVVVNALGREHVGVGGDDDGLLAVPSTRSGPPPARRPGARGRRSGGWCRGRRPVPGRGSRCRRP